MQDRACARRLITHLGVKCTLRSDVEICMLCSRHDPGDHFVAECISIFQRFSFPAHRLLQLVPQAKQHGQKGRAIARAIQVRQGTTEARLQDLTIEVYGYRGQAPAWYHLSVYEVFACVHGCLHVSGPAPTKQTCKHVNNTRVNTTCQQYSIGRPNAMSHHLGRK